MHYKACEPIILGLKRLYHRQNVDSIMELEDILTQPFHRPLRRCTAGSRIEAPLRRPGLARSPHWDWY